MKEIIKKIPNWLRYILAIPLSIVGAYALEFLFLFFAAMSGDYNTDLFILIERYIIVNVATYFWNVYYIRNKF